MATEDKLELDVMVDVNTTIKNIEISTGFVPLLQNSLLYVLSTLEDPSTIVEIYAKIDKAITDPSVRLNQFESTVYALTTLAQNFKLKAIEQGNILKDVKPNPVSKESASKVLEELLKQNDKNFNPEELNKALEKLNNEAFPNVS